jgi:hypothetical protein
MQFDSVLLALREAVSVGGKMISLSRGKRSNRAF